MTDLDDDRDFDCCWSDPIPDGVRHMAASDDGRLVCCGQEAALIPAGDGLTPDPQRVTCSGPEAS